MHQKQDILFLLVPSKNNRSSRPEEFLRKGVLKICSKFGGDHPCRSVISIKLLCNFIEIALRHGCSPVTLLHNFRTPFPKSTSGWLLLKQEPSKKHFKNQLKSSNSDRRASRILRRVGSKLWNRGNVWQGTSYKYCKR